MDVSMLQRVGSLMYLCCNLSVHACLYVAACLFMHVSMVQHVCSWSWLLRASSAAAASAPTAAASPPAACCFLLLLALPCAPWNFTKLPRDELLFLFASDVFKHAERLNHHDL
jgi:hypothetical protein